MPKTIIRYAQGQSDDLAPLKSVGIDDDSATAWWGGAQKCFASVALAAVLASTALATVCAEQISQGEQSDVPAGSLVNLKVDEDYWQNPERPITASFYQALPYFFDPAEIVPAPAAFQPDEDYWQNEVPPIQAALFRSTVPPDQQEIPAGSLFGQPDEDFWRNPVPPVTAALAWPQQWAFDIQESAGSLFGQYDEDFWRSGVAPVWWTNLYPKQSGFDVQEPAGSLFGQFDEDFWRNPVASVPANLYHSPILGDQEEIPAGSLLAGEPDEDYWQNPTRPIAAAIYQQLPYLFESADFVPLVVPEFDEDFWQNPVPPVQASLYRTPVFRDPEEVPAGALLKSQAVDEYYWQNWVRPVVASLYQQFPYAFDSGELNAPAQNGTALPAGLSLVAAENNPTGSTQVPGGGGGRRRGRMYPVPVSERQPTSAGALARGQALSARAGQVSASGTAQATVSALRLTAQVGKPTAKGIRNPTDEELIAILMGL